MPHANIPIFIPHLGCPNQCVFCNQRSISGCREFDVQKVPMLIEQTLKTLPLGTDTEIAFFGGSFTGIDRALMIALLDIAQRYVNAGKVQSIRLSTRPDYINDKILAILSRYTVGTIELGLQSMDDTVLNASGRGHTAKQARDACCAVVQAGFSLVGQMMIGLPEATPETELSTAREICNLGACAARIYPTVVFYQTPLSEAVKNGSYQPLTVTEAVERSAAVLRVFVENNVPCIRIGLCAGEDFSSSDSVMAGPNHAALGELVWNELYYENLIASLKKAGLLGREVILHLPMREISKYVGQHKCNINRLLRETDTRVYKIVGEQNLNQAMPILRSPLIQQQEEKQTCI